MSKYFDDGVCRYLYDDRGFYTVEKCPRPVTEITIPPEINGSPVTAIADFAFNCKTIIKNIRIPEGIVSIGDLAFNSCASLERIVIPESVTQVGKSAFSGCLYAKTIVIPPSVTEIGEGAFEDSEELERIFVSSGSFAHKWIEKNLPSAVDGEKISFYAAKKSKTEDAGEPVYEFKYEITDDGVSVIAYTGLGDSVRIPKKIEGTRVTSLAADAFRGCNTVKKIFIPETVEHISCEAFNLCPALQTISVSDASPFFSSCDGVLYDKEKGTLIRFPEGSPQPTFNTPDTVKTIGENAFFSCSTACLVHLNNSIERIETRAFKNCTVTELILPPSVTYVGSYAFSCCQKLEEITISPILEHLGRGALEDCKKLKKVYAVPGTPSVDLIKKTPEIKDLLSPVPQKYYTECIPYMNQKLRESGIDLSSLQGMVDSLLDNGSLDLSKLSSLSDVAGFSDVFGSKIAPDGGDDDEGDEDAFSEEVEEEDSSDTDGEENEKKRAVGYTIIPINNGNISFDDLLKEISSLEARAERGEIDLSPEDAQMIDSIFDSPDKKGKKGAGKKGKSAPKNPMRAISDSEFESHLNEIDDLLRRTETATLLEAQNKDKE